MVLKDGGPCIAFRKDKETGNMVVCGKVRAHIFYAGPTCKDCYDKETRRKRQSEGAVPSGVLVDMEALQEESQETLVEIEEIYASRCVRARTRDPQPSVTPQPSVLAALLAHTQLALTFASDPPCAHGHRLSKIPRERRERRDALEDDEKALEYDVYGKFEYDRGNGKKSKPEWGRRWCSIGECAQVDDWVDSLKTYEIELKAARLAAQQTYGEADEA